jgi:hypothetical protein
LFHCAGYSLGEIRRTCSRDGLVPTKQRATYKCSAIDKHLTNQFYAALEHPHPQGSPQIRPKKITSKAANGSTGETGFPQVYSCVAAGDKSVREVR